MSDLSIFLISRLLVDADNACIVFMQLLGPVIQLAYRSNLAAKLDFVFCFVIQAVFMPVGLKISLILKNARYFLAKSLLPFSCR
uniref:Uncharacterized protein n=1 Tax=Candidatus Kentrum sp. SD TaxID=2126332 RepID=A0A450YG96_9GAMM|nr:MAG: hypothetical protein BECKSD772F_GA0070984_106212 [Candidatus Kentron sp. SD]VFK46052.1 MAG: hypothetical protein BECKSD772E_GA0070983_106611 [Candidatus Kentron sp. SD]